ncbi:MAG TPA: carbamoyl phosphate synthase small subunit [Lactobacillus sp.]|uniref:Carbamoyl phosphate synthase small chain n=1 Tax=Secundilactobacillus silagincola TaxID=1714681 RepID=A0A1Z5J1F3_9LACO|nr:carbamoyl phosphate synthase small subunit [Secundilactobacillus silagincola]GAX07873.1 carbamoyl phosphate synthase small subunit [Secundilactobacillus silagincola]HBF75643.1 carbamoyl phosphate synthase small subunit [Lactobacillus sp.]
MAQRFLILEDGSVYPGQGFGAGATTTGEIVFNTSMLGYQEIVTNQIYHNQIIVFSQPIVGSIGIAHDAYESILPTAKGMVVRDVTDISKNRQRSLSLDQFLKQHNIPGISGIDTRHLIRQINQTGTIKGSIVDVADDHAFDQLHATVLTNQQVAQVATPRPYPNPNQGYNVVVIDFGLKHGILRQLSKRDCNVTVLPWDASAQDVINLDPDGVLLSTGPGSPLDLPESVLDMIRTIQERIPLFAIGLGHELFALANGSEITKLKLSHHGANHPIRKIITNEIIYAMESQEYVVDPDSVNRDRLITTYLDLIDGSIQGLRHRDYPAFSVQFFPDGAPGPNDSVDLFDEFIEIMGTRK